jgi:hypothetical protein
MDINITQDLARAWLQAVTAGNIVNEFEADQDDPAGRWAHGDLVRFGLAWSDGAITYCARNVRTAQVIEAPVEERAIGATGFCCQFNGYRALRPGGAPRRIGRQPEISPAVADCRFFCQDPSRGLSLLSRAPLLQVGLANGRWNAYYNSNPFEKEGHFLLVPALTDGTPGNLPHLPQLLSRESVEDLVDFFRQSPGTIVFFNSLHAGASVNHLHAQAVFHKHRLPIEEARTAEYKGFKVLEGYPAQAICFGRNSDLDPIVAAVDRVQRLGIPFNLILLGECILLVPRAAEHEIVAEFPGGVLATMEIAGKIITVDRQVYENIQPADVTSAMNKATLDVRELIDLLVPA